eukprot:gnl/TRDRNA2_/TRDRNA2_128397_c0_seq1.p1 gnl/TRDRNA2_/TRDRNA2_128397_c0~~gnl/TRDRNA2_/TRDRNA2_128397_c0_seq1.p1  ORF type:complete len:529 (+),score=68.79 gnl/TRDRNA2_/TRDRNA2_128397_c0_seq1:105-1691(+)
MPRPCRKPVLLVEPDAIVHPEPPTAVSVMQSPTGCHPPSPPLLSTPSGDAGDHASDAQSTASGPGSSDSPSFDAASGGSSPSMIVSEVSSCGHCSGVEISLDVPLTPLKAVQDQISELKSVRTLVAEADRIQNEGEDHSDEELPPDCDAFPLQVRVDSRLRLPRMSDRYITPDKIGASDMSTAASATEVSFTSGSGDSGRSRGQHSHVHEKLQSLLHAELEIFTWPELAFDSSTADAVSSRTSSRHSSPKIRRGCPVEAAHRQFLADACRARYCIDGIDLCFAKEIATAELDDVQDMREARSAFAERLEREVRQCILGAVDDSFGPTEAFGPLLHLAKVLLCQMGLALVSAACGGSQLALCGGERSVSYKLSQTGPGVWELHSEFRATEFVFFQDSGAAGVEPSRCSTDSTLRRGCSVCLALCEDSWSPSGIRIDVLDVYDDVRIFRTDGSPVAFTMSIGRNGDAVDLARSMPSRLPSRRPHPPSATPMVSKWLAWASESKNAALSCCCAAGQRQQFVEDISNAEFLL